MSLAGGGGSETGGALYLTGRRRRTARQVARPHRGMGFPLRTVPPHRAVRRLELAGHRSPPSWCHTVPHRRTMVQRSVTGAIVLGMGRDLKGRS
ncbi:hypothetical protein Stsp01_22330 [Streptomyces sp. NBRC 13847]|nr:hypothetical protein Stsp01_22330 [Streptomyces sp. NBRC 13847]